MGKMYTVSVYVRVCKYISVDNANNLYPVVSHLKCTVRYVITFEEQKATDFWAAIRARPLCAPVFLHSALFTLYCT
jgi:hypothetical protein